MRCVARLCGPSQSSCLSIAAAFTTTPKGTLTQNPRPGNAAHFEGITKPTLRQVVLHGRQTPDLCENRQSAPQSRTKAKLNRDFDHLRFCQTNPVVVAWLDSRYRRWKSRQSITARLQLKHKALGSGSQLQNPAFQIFHAIAPSAPNSPLTEFRRMRV